MEAQYYSLLPGQVKLLTEEIEKKLGAEIIIRSKDKNASVVVNDPSIAELSVSTDSGSVKAEILYGDDVSVRVSSLPARALVHEVLHIHRIVVQATPGIIRNPNSPGSYKEIAVRLTNDVDHFHIIPHEIGLHPESLRKWEDDYDELLAKHAPFFNTPNLDAVKTGKLREYLVSMWFVASTSIPAWKGLSSLQSVLQQKGWFTDADAVVRAFQGAKNSDIPACISALIKANGLDPKDFRQTRLDISGVKFICDSLP